MRLYLIQLSFFFVSTLACWAQTPQRIISLVPSLTQNLYYLQAQDQLVGCTSYCTAAKSDNKTIVSSAIKVSLEKVASLKPDLVLATGLTPQKEISTLRKLGIRVEILAAPKSFIEVCSQFQTFGELIGKGADAKQIIAQITHKVDSIKQHANRLTQKPKILIQVGANPIYAATPNTYMDDFIIYAGGINPMADLTNSIVGRELVIARNPDYIFITTMGTMGEEEKAIYERFPQLAATKKKQIFTLDAEVACLPTPIDFLRTLEILTQHIH